LRKARKQVAKAKRKKSFKRGYPVALLVGFEDNHAVLWQVFSQTVKLHLTVELNISKPDELSKYMFHESIVKALRPLLKEGVRAVVIVAPRNTTYAADFLDHVQRHHIYLTKSKAQNKTVFGEIVGSASQYHTVVELLKTEEFRSLVAETTSGEADHLVNTLEKHLFNIDNDSVVLYSLKEIEDMIYGREKLTGSRAEYLILTDKYLTGAGDKKRIQRLLQISKNKKIMTRIVNAETSAGKRISQFGGMVFLNISNSARLS